MVRHSLTADAVASVVVAVDLADAAASAAAALVGLEAWALTALAHPEKPNHSRSLATT